MTAADRDRETLRSALAGRRGRGFWRTLEELSGTAAFKRFAAREFGSAAPELSGVDRRVLLKVMGASLALAGLSACDGQSGDESAAPYVKAPEGTQPGTPRWYASAVTLNGYAQPLLGKAYSGRPVKLEGNPDHPATGGATDAFLQAALLGLYDPDRSQGPRHLGRATSWAEYDAALAAAMRGFDADGGVGVRLLTGSVTSPTLLRQIDAVLKRWPEARHHVFEPIDDANWRAASTRAFGRVLERHVRLDAAEVVVSLDDDVLSPGPHQAVHGRRWGQRRAAFQTGDRGSRLFLAEATPSLTGIVADERLIVSPLRMGVLAQALAAALGGGGASAELTVSENRWIARAAAALRAVPGRGLILMGLHHPPEMQALMLHANAAIDALGKTLRFTAPLAREGETLAALVDDMTAGRVSGLFVLDSNPAYGAPGVLGFEAALGRVPFSVHAGLYGDETGLKTTWHVPLAHELEAWGDARAVDGTASIIQPLIKPFYDVRALPAVLAPLTGQGGEARDLVRETWHAALGDAFEARWTDVLVRGFVPGSAPAFETVSVAAAPITVPALAVRDGLVVVVRPDETIWDGRFADNAWLQELSKPISKITWGNVALIAPSLAQTTGLNNGDEIEIAIGGAKITAPAWVMPGQDASTIVLSRGYGRRLAEHVSDGLGYDVAPLLPKDGGTFFSGASLRSTGAKLKVACTQTHQQMGGFDFVKAVASPEAPVKKAGAQASFYTPDPPADPSWGMSIDLDLCFGCNACVAACTAENNIPVVGKDLVAEGREMQWLRVDHYFEGDEAAPRSHAQPVPCMHCEQAPCEMGCPVNAAVHSSDGLNLQVYNRCIGTRTCSSYCPYKVRRFNWFDYTSDAPEETKALRNPEVTVRSRGVMEKCTYCVQRIEAARIAAKIEGRPIADGEVRTACEQACPSRAIVFGNVADAGSAVSKRKASARDYALLEEANTRPRTTYLARIRPEPESG